LKTRRSPFPSGAILNEAKAEQEKAAAAHAKEPDQLVAVSEGDVTEVAPQTVSGIVRKIQEA
jgi:hypothetical protein